MIDESPSIADISKWNALQRRIQEINIAGAFDLFRENGIEPIIFKGWAAARYYPDNVFRSTHDLDISVPSSQYGLARSIAASSAGRKFVIDLHREFRNHDKRSWDELFTDSKLIETPFGSIRVLSDEDHLRSLVTHWLYDGGEYKEKLWDIYYLIDSTRNSFNWEKCLSAASDDRRRWIAIVVLLASKYLELDISTTPAEIKNGKIPGWIIQELEKKWDTDLRMVPLDDVISSPAKFIQQLRLRFPPNPIQATIESEGSLDSRFQYKYQLKSIIKRSGPSVHRILASLKRGKINIDE